MTLVNFAEKPVSRSRNKRFPSNAFLMNTPLVNIHELDDSYQVQLAIPGIPKEQIQLNVKDDQLIIEATKQTIESSTPKTEYIRKEYDFNTFKKVFHLNEEINQAAIHATVIDGILTITLDKKEEAKGIPPRSITIK